jgi:hypothetical protein
VTSTVTRTELPSQRGKSVLSKMHTKDAMSNGSGTSDSECAAASAWVLNALAIWMRNG